MHKFRDTNVEESLHCQYPFNMPQAALAKFPFPIDPRCSPLTLNNPHDARRCELGPEPDDTHQQLPVGLSSIHRYLTFRIHDVSLSDARFEEIRSCTDSENQSEVEAEISLQCHMWSRGDLSQSTQPALYLP